MIDDRARLRELLSPPWDDLRQQRLLGPILAARRAQRAGQPRRWLNGKGVSVGLAAGMAAAMVALAVGLHFKRLVPLAEQIASPGDVQSATEEHRLDDGSRFFVENQARVETIEQSTKAVELRQMGGRVTYDVRHDPDRAFSVRAGDVVVRVRGTRFRIGLQDDWVDVQVERGRVEVEGRGARTTDLVAGEAFRTRAFEPPEGASANDKELSPLRPRDPRPLTDPAARSDVRRRAPNASNAPANPSADDLLARADQARAAGRHGEASEALHDLVAHYPSDPRVASAWFTLGRVERSRGLYPQSAEAFQFCYRTAPRGPLAEEATAEEAASWLTAKNEARAKAAARRYVQSYPAGRLAPRMRTLAE